MITLENDNIGKEEREREKGKTYLSVDKRPNKGRENLVEEWKYEKQEYSRKG